MEASQQIWKNRRDLGKSKWTISGSSTAGLRTSFYIPELKILLDSGYHNFNNVTEIFITHQHADHIASLPLNILENIHHKIVTNIYCPNDCLKFIENMVEAFLACNFNNYSLPKKLYNFYPMCTKYKLSKNFNNTELCIETFESDHSVPTLSYGFIEKKKKLKEEYIGLNKEEIIELKSKKIELTYITLEKKFVFCGDTTSNIFIENPEILGYESILVECTFFDKKDISLSKERKHMHWSDLKVIVINNPSVNFYIIHRSAKHSDNRRLQEEYLTSINNVFLLD